MFVDVIQPVELGPALTVPRSAVLDSGSRQMVFIDKGEGNLEARKVTTGWRYGDRVEILSGLKRWRRGGHLGQLPARLGEPDAISGGRPR